LLFPPDARGDGDSGPLALARVVRDWVGETGGGRRLGIVVQLALGARAEQVRAAAYLLGQLVRRPGPDREQPQQRVRRGGLLSGLAGRGHAASWHAAACRIELS